MIRKLTLLLIIELFCGTFVFGQSNKIVSTTSKPYVSSYTKSTSVNAITIYEQYTVVELSITNWTNNLRMRIKSNSYIIDPTNSNNIYPIVMFENNEMDKVYTWGNKGKTNYIRLYFGRIPPGIKKVNIIINPKEDDQYNWLGVVINNPDNHPKTTWTEYSLKKEWDQNGYDPLEGIYENTIQSAQSPKYKLALKKENDHYNLIYLTGADYSTWKTGDVKAILNETATPLLFKVKWFLGNKAPNENLYITFDQGTMKIIWTDQRTTETEQLYLKLYPKSSINSNIKGGTTSGTGFAISSDGYIVTNHHVIDGVENLTVKGVNGDFDKTYKAKIILADKNNDLALIKIEDPLFSSLGKIPFVLKTSVASVGENIFVLGYPLRATMGDEIKLTNGIISSKTGFQGDITSYQISAPVQPGNSGGPLFDKNGNLIGIINAKHLGAENASYAVKSLYLQNLIDLLDNPIQLSNISLISTKSLPQQVELVKKFVFIIEGQ